jgi:hypothetical protein
MVLNVTFHNILAIPWLSVLLMEETGVPEKKHTDLSQVTMDVNEHERISNITLRHKLKQRNGAYH